MYSQLIKQCIQNSTYKVYSFKISIRSLCQASAKEPPVLEQNTNVKNKNVADPKYPGYVTIYKYNNIRYMSLYNKIKKYMLISSAALIPTMFALDKMNIVNEVTAMTVPTMTFLVTISLYINGILADNQIGFIYYKDDSNIKIAYVDIWGKRVDIDTSVEDIKSLTDNRPSFTDKLFRSVHLKSLKHPLKLVVNRNTILNEDLIVHILGDYE